MTFTTSLKISVASTYRDTGGVRETNLGSGYRCPNVDTYLGKRPSFRCLTGILQFFFYFLFISLSPGFCFLYLSFFILVFGLGTAARFPRSALSPHLPLLVVFECFVAWFFHLPGVFVFEMHVSTFCPISPCILLVHDFGNKHNKSASRLLVD